MIDFSLTQAPAVPDLLRVGRPGDGGYAVPQSMLGACDGVIGAGVRDDWTFEAAARALMPRCACLHLYDPTTHARQLWWRALKTLHKCVAHAATLDGTRLREDLHRLLAPLRYARLRRDGITHFKEWVGGNAGLPMSTLISRAAKDGPRSHPRPLRPRAARLSVPGGSRSHVRQAKPSPPASPVRHARLPATWT